MSGCDGSYLSWRSVRRRLCPPACCGHCYLGCQPQSEGEGIRCSLLASQGNCLATLQLIQFLLFRVAFIQSSDRCSSHMSLLSHSLLQATVQAALASGPLEAIHSTKMLDPAWKGQCNVEDSPFLGDPEFVDFCVWDDWGQDIVTTAVFAILLTAPLGVLCIANVGPLWLTKV